MDLFTKPQVYAHFEIKCNSKTWAVLIAVLGLGLHIRNWSHFLQWAQEKLQESSNFKNASFRVLA